jgi:hypothetical protein
LRISRKRKSLFWNGTKFDSLSEISCAKSLTLYCDWQVKEGETYQVPIGHRKLCDFQIAGVLVEYHPITLPHAMTDAAYNTLKTGLGRINQRNKSARRIIRDAFKQQLLYEYTHKRLWTIREQGDTRELIVVETPLAFYSKVLKRFKSQGVQLPKMKAYEDRFRQQDFKIR